MRWRKYVSWAIVAVILGGYWLLPITGQVVILPDPGARLPWPQFRLDPPSPVPGQELTVQVTDRQPWTFVTLTVNGISAWPDGWRQNPGGTYTWIWDTVAPESEGYALVFYHDCHTGCIERGRIAVGEQPAPLASGRVPTKLGVVFPDLDRDWHQRGGWAVEVAYARLPEETYWGVDDLASRVSAHTAKGLRVLIRVDYDHSQSLPPTDDYLALTEYLEYLRRLARDDRLRSVYGYVIGNDFNTQEANALAPQHPVTPAWYARLFNGYGEDITHQDNAVQVVRAENPGARVIVGPLRPWSMDQDGAQPYVIDVPWLNYMNTLVALLDESAQTKAAGGVPLVAPDGFDVQAPGRPDVPEMAGRARADEPRLDLARAEWDGAQAGFRVYQDWLAIINAYPSTRGLPVYIISTNTYDREANVPPAQNYPSGWLTSALDVVNAEPQVHALCWFLDNFPHGEQWDWFSLTQQLGRLRDAAEEFDDLLR